MNEMIGYIFGSLRNSEAAIKQINKTLRCQTQFNSKVSIFAMCTTACLVMQYRKIETLRKEIEELKSVKGE